MAKLTPVARLLTVLSLTALVALSLPYAALAQGAGDEQYADPFGEVPEEAPAADENAGNGSGETPQPDDESAPAPTSGSGSAPEEATAGVVTQAEPAATTTPAPELARTGLDAGAVALFGLWLLVTGATLRLAVSPLPRPPDHPRR